MALPSDVGSMAPLIAGVGEATTVNRPDPEALLPNIGAMVQDVARLLRRRFERRARQSGLPLTRQQARALLLIARNEGLSQSAIATMLDIEPIALVRLLDKLHEEGLVERRAHPTDRRIRTLWLTPLAWRVIDQVLTINIAVREEACAGLSPGAREVLMQALGHLKSNLGLAEETETAAAD